jgi:Uma2 family endonuclease
LADPWKRAVRPDAGVPLGWVADPPERTVLVYRPGAEPEPSNSVQELAGDPHLPGLRVPVARRFDR